MEISSYTLLIPHFLSYFTLKIISSINDCIFSHSIHVGIFFERRQFYEKQNF